MAEEKIKPLNWQADPNVGYTVVRRPDGGMHFTFKDNSRTTMEHWRAFALDHLLDSDRLTRNLYDLRLLDDISEEAVQYAIEVNNDPSVRNIRMAVVATNEKVIKGMRKIGGLTTAPGGVEFALFADMDEAETWLNRPLTIVS
jgi:hypothetical protein